MPAKKPTSSVDSTARNRFGTSAMHTRASPAPTMAGPKARRRDRSPSSRGPAPTPPAMPRNTDPNSSPYAACPPPTTVSANSCPCAMIAPPAASEPSMPTSRPRTSGSCRAKARPSVRLASTLGAGSPAALGATFGLGISPLSR